MNQTNFVPLYVPARHPVKGEEVLTLKYAATQLEELLSTHNLTEDELLAEFKMLQKQKKT